MQNAPPSIKKRSSLWLNHVCMFFLLATKKSAFCPCCHVPSILMSAMSFLDGANERQAKQKTVTCPVMPNGNNACAILDVQDRARPCPLSLQERYCACPRCCLPDFLGPETILLREIRGSPVRIDLLYRTEACLPDD